GMFILYHSLSEVEKESDSFDYALIMFQTNVFSDKSSDCKRVIIATHKEAHVQGNVFISSCTEISTHERLSHLFKTTILETSFVQIFNKELLVGNELLWVYLIGNEMV
ncbi:hypothetical protein ACJX0J_017950, partial [Zea mays]